MFFSYFVVAFLLDDVNDSLSGPKRFVLNMEADPTNHPKTSSSNNRNADTARYKSLEVILNKN